MFQPIQNLIPRTANKMGIGREFQAIQACKAAEKVIKGIFEHLDSNQISVKSFKKGTLNIELSSSALNQEVSMRKGKIIELTNKELNKNLVKDLSCLLKA